MLSMAPVCNNKDPKGSNMIIKSDNFKEGEMIPIDNTCEGKNEPVRLSWENVPKNAQSLALIMDDPDAPSGTFVHWIAWNIDPKINSLDAQKSLVQQGLNGASKVGYYGPCPPSGVHRYYFKLYALDIKLELSAHSPKSELLKAMDGHIISTAQIMGRYQKKL